MLLEAGADVNIRSISNQTPEELHNSLFRHSHAKVIRDFIEEKSKVEDKEENIEAIVREVIQRLGINSKKIQSV